MRVNLLFHIELLKQRTTFLMFFILGEILFILSGFLWTYIPISIVYGATVIFHSIIFLLLMNSMCTQTNRQGNANSTTENCVYFPMTRRSYYEARAVMTLVILVIQMGITVVAVLVNRITSHTSIAPIYYVIGMLLCMSGIFCCGIFDMLFSVPMWRNQSAINMIWVPCSVMIGGVGGYISSASSTFTFKVTLAAFFVCLASWLLSIILAMVLYQKSNN